MARSLSHKCQYGQLLVDFVQMTCEDGMASDDATIYGATNIKYRQAFSSGSSLQGGFRPALQVHQKEPTVL